VAVKDMKRLEKIEGSIREQEAIQREVEKGRKELAEKTAQAKREIAEIPDSLEAFRSRRLMDQSFSLAKAEGILEQKATWAEKRLEYLEGEKHAVKTHFVRWSLILGATEFLLVGGVVVLALRRPGLR
jgi:septal ring factor EnvC (AmiA/AmiB activator)